MNVQPESSNLSTPSSSQEKKSVRFAEMEEVHDVLRRRSQISRKSMQGIWFDGQDFDAFSNEMDKCLKKMERGERLKDKKYTSLGLEYRTEEGSALKYANREYAWDMVMWEQKQQEKEGMRSSMQLREAYREASRDAEVRAVELARQVSDEVYGIYTKAGLEPQFEPSDHDEDDEPPAALLRTKPVRVRFAEEPEVHDVLRRRSQISRESKAGVWFDSEEFDTFRSEMEDCIEKIDEGKRVSSNDQTSLGLETHTADGRSLRHADQDDSWDAVLDEQEAQREDGILSPFQIARAYRKVSKDAVLRAIDLARQVSNEVQADDDDFGSLRFCPTNASA